MFTVSRNVAGASIVIVLAMAALCVREAIAGSGSITTNSTIASGAACNTVVTYNYSPVLDGSLINSGSSTFTAGTINFALTDVGKYLVVNNAGPLGGIGIVLATGGSGSNYAAGDTITLTGGTFTTATVVTVDVVSVP